MPSNKSSLKKVIVKHFFDFFMLFLAVTLGFFVDNYRDKSNAGKTAHELAADLVTDISADTVSLHELLNHCEIKKQKLDSLYQLINDGRDTFNDTLIYGYSAYVGLRPWFERNSSTFRLLTGSGYLNYFKKDAAAAITEYDISCEKTIGLLETERSIITAKIYPFQQEVFHTENFYSILKNGQFVVKPVLHKWTKETQWLYHNYITEMKIINTNISRQYTELLSIAEKTIAVLNKEYQ